MSCYIFDAQVAKKYGVDEAIILQALIFWIRKNKAENRNMHPIEINGEKVERTWTFNTINTWASYFPFWTQWQVERIINSLKKQNVIVTGHFENDPWKRKLSYALVDEDAWLEKDGVSPFGETTKSIVLNTQMDSAKHTNVTTDVLRTDSKQSSIESFGLKNSSPEKKNMLRNEIKELLLEVLPLGGFTNRPPSADKPVPKLFLEAQAFLTLLPRPRVLVREYAFDPKWVKDSNIDFKWFEGRPVEPLVRKAVKRFATMRVEGYEPERKDILNKSINDFFYNKGAQKSWFLYCVFNEPKLVRGEGRMKGCVDLSEEERSVLLSHKRKEWGESEYLVKASSLLAWYKKNEKDLVAYNYYVKDHVQTWKEKFATIDKFLTTIDEFARSWEGWRLGNFGQGNKTWSRFVTWCLQEFDVVLDLTVEEIKSARAREVVRARESKAIEEEREHDDNTVEGEAAIVKAAALESLRCD